MKKPPVIFITSFINALAINMLMYSMVFYAKSKFGAGGRHAGAMLGFYYLLYITACLFSKRLVSGLVPQKSVKIALMFYVAGTSCMYLAPYLGFVYLGLAFCGIGTTFFWPPLMGWASDGLEGKELSRTTGIYNLSWSTGAILGPIIGGVLCDWNDRLAILVIFLIYLAFLGYYLIAYAHIKGTPVFESKDLDISGYATELRYPCWIGVVATWFTISFLSGVYPYAAEQVFNISRSEIGVILSGRVITMTLAVTGLGFLSFWQYQSRQLIIGHAAFGIITVFLGFFSNTYVLFGIMSLMGFFAGQAYINSQFHGVAGSSERTWRMTIHESLLSFGSILGSTSCGFIYERTSLRGACFVCAGVMGIAVIADAWYTFTHKKKL